MENQGKLIGLARTPQRLAAMEEMPRAIITTLAGITGDARGHKRGRQVSVLFREDWEAACRDVPGLGAVLPWVTRRANLLVEGLVNPRRAGGHIVIGEVVLEVAAETEPCELMEKAHAGLRAAMTPDWRGGVCCKVVKGGEITYGNFVTFA